MQKIVTKYGLAAHLALLAVAPLFLFPFCGEGTVAYVLLWLSALAIAWTLMEPSVLEGEMPHDARRRVWAGICRDPLFWAMLVIVVAVGVRALNDGVALSYDAEAMKWNLRKAAMPLMPCSVRSAGFLPFSAAVALWVVLMAIRHAMGKSSRMAFALLSSALAGASALVNLLAYFSGHDGVNALLSGDGASRTFSAISYGVYFLGGTVALIGSFERQWNRAMPLLALSLGGTGAGLYAFGTPEAIAVFALADLPIFLYSFFFGHKVLHRSGEFKCLVVYGLSLTIAAVAIMAILPKPMVMAKLTQITTANFLTDGFMELRGVLSEIALRTWKTEPWLGSGLGSFGLEVRLNATEANWLVIPHGQASALNGGWQLLAERGIVGAVMVALPVGMLFVSYVIGVWRGIVSRWLPHPMCFVGVFAFAAVVTMAFVDTTFLRPETVLGVCAMMALSANSFPKEKITNG